MRPRTRRRDERMRSQKRGIALLLCAALVLALIVPSCYMISMSGHTCTGKCCVICAAIVHAADGLRVLTGLLPAALLLLVSVVFHTHVEAEHREMPVRCTLVSWKIRLDD